MKIYSLLACCALVGATAGFALPAVGQPAPPTIHQGNPANAPAASTVPAATKATPPTASDAPSTRPQGAPGTTSVTASSRAAAGIIDSAAVRGEPVVQHTVIEDKGSRIDELKVRGQTKKITVTPKQGLKLQYEVLVNDGTGMGDSAASQTPHGNEGRRVWNVLSF